MRFSSFGERSMRFNRTRRSLYTAFAFLMLIGIGQSELAPYKCEDGTTTCPELEQLYATTRTTRVGQIPVGARIVKDLSKRSVLSDLIGFWQCEHDSDGTSTCLAKWHNNSLTLTTELYGNVNHRAATIFTMNDHLVIYLPQGNDNWVVTLVENADGKIKLLFKLNDNSLEYTKTSWVDVHPKIRTLLDPHRRPLNRSRFKFNRPGRPGRPQAPPSNRYKTLAPVSIPKVGQTSPQTPTNHWFCVGCTSAKAQWQIQTKHGGRAVRHTKLGNRRWKYHDDFTVATIVRADETECYRSDCQGNRESLRAKGLLYQTTTAYNEKQPTNQRKFEYIVEQCP